MSARLPELPAGALPGANNAAAHSSSRSLQASQERFRPNLVVDGPQLQPFVEDAWQGMRVGSTDFRTISAPLLCVMQCSTGLHAARLQPMSVKHIRVQSRCLHR